MAPTGLETEAVELVLPHGRSVRRRRVEGYALPVAVAVSALADAEPTHPSGAAWQAATRFALRLLADGRLHPALTPAGYDTWQAGPCTAAQRRTLDALAAAFPPHAHCLPEPGPAPVRIVEPAALVRQFCDAVADDLVRTPAAPLAMGALPYAWREARAVPALREWAEETQAALTAEVSVSVRVDVPEGRRRQFRAVLQLHTAADPTLVVEAARLWSEPTEVERLLGPRAETETLLALRRGARVWPPLRRLLNDAAPDRAPVDRRRSLRSAGRRHGRAARGRCRRALAARAGQGAHRDRGDRAAHRPRLHRRRPARRRGAPRLPLADRPRRRAAHRGGDGRPRRGPPARRAAARPVGGRRPEAGGPRQAPPDGTAHPHGRAGRRADRRGRGGRRAGSPARRSARSATCVARIRDPESRTPVPAARRAQGHAARLPAAGPGLAGRDDLARPRRLPRRRHGPGQDHHPHRPAPAPPDRPRHRGPHPGGLPGLPARQLAARGRQVRPGSPPYAASTAATATSTTWPAASSS